MHKDNKNKYDPNGFNRNGMHEDTKNKYNLNGFNRNGVYKLLKINMMILVLI